MLEESVVLVVRDKAGESETIVRILGDQYCLVAVEDPEEALAHPSDNVGLLIIELDSRRFSPLELLRKWKTDRPQSPALAVADGRDVNTAVDAMKLGAADCIVKPLNPSELRAVAARLIQAHRSASGQQQGELEPKAIDIPPGTSLEDLERAAVEQALAQHQGNRTHAARTLGISVRTLQRKLKAWGLPLMAMQHSSPGHHFGLPQNQSSQPGAQSSFGVHAH